MTTKCRPGGLRYGCCAVALIGAVIAAAQNAQPKKSLDVPYVPTTEEAVDAMLKLAEVKKTDVVYDLGCGDGRIVIAEANANAKRAGVEKLVRFEENDLFKAEFKDATVVTLFLLSSVNLKLKPKLLAELKPGTRIVSNTFDMGDWKPEREYTVPNTDDDSFLSHHLYLWTVPVK
jgi:hypothetical protein